MKGIFKMVLLLLVGLPDWAYALECSVCRKSFNSPVDHFNHAHSPVQKSQHKGKIPKI